MNEIASTLLSMGIGLLPDLLLNLLLGPVILFFAFRLTKAPVSYPRSLRIFLGYFFITFIVDLPFLLLDWGAVLSLVRNVASDLLVGVFLVKWRLKVPLKKAALSFGMAYAVLFSMNYVSNLLWSIDDEVDQLAQKALEHPQANRPHDENLFVAFIGLNHQQKDPIAVGTKLIETHEANVDAVSWYYEKYIKRIAQCQRLEFKGSDAGHIDGLELSSPEDVRALAKIYDQNPSLMGDYKKLRSYSYYENPMTPSLVQPHLDPFDLLRLNRVALGEAISGLSSRDYESFVRDVSGELDLYRLIHEKAENQFNLRMAKVFLKKTILAYGAALDDADFVQSGNLLEESRLSLSDDDTSVRRDILYEYRAFAQMARSFDPEAERTAKPNMTINYAYRLFREIEDDMARPPREITGLFSKQYHRKRALMDVLRNPVGSAVAQNTVENIDFLKYRLNSIDMGVTFRLVHIKQLIRAQNVPYGDIGAFVRDLPSNLKDPYSSKPFEWDASAGTLSCTRKGKYRDEVISIEIPALEQVPSPPLQREEE